LVGIIVRDAGARDPGFGIRGTKFRFGSCDCDVDDRGLKTESRRFVEPAPVVSS